MNRSAGAICKTLTKRGDRILSIRRNCSCPSRHWSSPNGGLCLRCGHLVDRSVNICGRGQKCPRCRINRARSGRIERTNRQGMRPGSMTTTARTLEVAQSDFTLSPFAARLVVEGGDQQGHGNTKPANG